MAIGVTCGAGLYLISIMATLFIALIYVLLVKVRNLKRRYLLIVKYHNDAAEGVREGVSILNKVLKNKTTVKDYTELTYEISLFGEDTDFVTSLSEIEGVSSAVLVEFSGDYFE